jgi:hypothetical protein
MLRWHGTLDKRVENPKIDAFIAETVTVCEKHQLFIAHQDGGGAFEIRGPKLKKRWIGWIGHANDCSDE